MAEVSFDHEAYRQILGKSLETYGDYYKFRSWDALDYILSLPFEKAGLIRQWTQHVEGRSDVYFTRSRPVNLEGDDADAFKETMAMPKKWKHLYLAATDVVTYGGFVNEIDKLGIYIENGFEELDAAGILLKEKDHVKTMEIVGWMPGRRITAGNAIVDYIVNSKNLKNVNFGVGTSSFYTDVLSTILEEGHLEIFTIHKIPEDPVEFCRSVAKSHLKQIRVSHVVDEGGYHRGDNRFHFGVQEKILEYFRELYKVHIARPDIDIIFYNILPKLHAPEVFELFRDLVGDVSVSDAREHLGLPNSDIKSADKV